MSEIYLLTFILIILSSIQTIVGVGVLVIGTPILLLLDYSIVNILTILLPTSILISLINSIYFKVKYKKASITINKNLKKKFFFICIPSIFLGLLFLKNFELILNFKLIVSSVILFSLYLKLKFEKIKIISSKVVNSIMILIGVVHGISNSGGSLLSLFLIKLNNNNKISSRVNITFFYLFLALFQFLLFQILFNKIPKNLEILSILFSVLIGFLIGNFLEKLINNKVFDKFVLFLTALAAVMLIIRF